MQVCDSNIRKTKTLMAAALIINEKQQFLVDKQTKLDSIL